MVPETLNLKRGGDGRINKKITRKFPTAEGCESVAETHGMLTIVSKGRPTHGVLSCLDTTAREEEELLKASRTKNICYLERTERQNGTEFLPATLDAVFSITSTF